ncbi:MAG TPA: periplasmic heavy metal sensor [Gemmatimonadaceae bacterium]|nr:periplasmic heavy metal sensor [Gemmatimonadaceae bacterium]
MRRSILAFTFLIAAVTLAAQGPPPGQHGPGPGPDDWGRNFFPPEMVMQHQAEIGLQDAQRTALASAIQQAQAKFTEVQWKLSAEGEKLGRLLQSTQVDETQVLEQADRILAMERDIKRTQISLMVRIKNTLTAAQQAKLTEIRNRKE